MSQALIEELKRENLCTHFVLPLIKLNKNSFTHSGFLNTFLSRDKTKIVVMVADQILLPRKVSLHPNLLQITQLPNKHWLLWFRIPGKWSSDVQLFSLGKFTQLSDLAKEAIRRYGCLLYRVKRADGKVVTDGVLLALEGHRLLREMWERELYNSSDFKDADAHIPEELLSIPGEESYI